MPTPLFSLPRQSHLVQSTIHTQIPPDIAPRSHKNTLLRVQAAAAVAAAGAAHTAGWSTYFGPRICRMPL